MKKYNAKLVYPVQSPGNVANMRDIAMDSSEEFGVGIVDPDKIYDLYNDQHTPSPFLTAGEPQARRKAAARGRKCRP
jgi:hypothetical protein